MRQWTKSNGGLRVLIWVFDQFSNHCLANTVEPLRAANGFVGRDVFDWVLVSLDGGMITTSSGLAMQTQSIDQTKGDMLVVMPSYNYQTHANAATTRAIHRARADAIVALDTGAWLLALAGILDGRTATIHWDLIDTFAEAFPNVDVVRDRVVVDGHITTCGGAARAFDWVTDLIGERHGQSIRAQVIDLFHGNMRDPFVARGMDAMLALMRDHLEQPLPIVQIARQLGQGQKTLERRCISQLGVTPTKAYQFLRLNRAKSLLQSRNMTVSEAAIRTGYGSSSAFARAFKSEFGITPQQAKAQD